MQDKHKHKYKNENEESPYVFLLNSEIQMTISEMHDASERKYENYLINNPEFLALIKEKREQFGLIDIEKVEEQYLVEAASESIRRINEELDDLEARKLFYDSVEEIMTILDIPESWMFYVGAFLVNQEPPKSIGVTTHDRIEVISVSDEDEILVSLKPGLNRSDYLAAWPSLLKKLGKPYIYAKPFTHAKRNFEIYKDKENGMTYSDLAKKYFGEDEKSYVIDTVKKIVKRERDRVNKGIKQIK